MAVRGVAGVRAVLSWVAVKEPALTASLAHGRGGQLKRRLGACATRQAQWRQVELAQPPPPLTPGCHQTLVAF